MRWNPGPARSRLPGRARRPGREAEAVIDKVDLIEALRRPECFPHPVDAVELVETHISWVLLAGAFAYKLKKPVDFGFLDFSTLEARRHFCVEEIRLNRRLAPQLYLDVVPIAGPARAPRVGGAGEPIEYAVRMRRFRRENELDALAGRGELRPEHIDVLATRVADFHAQAETAPATGPWGTPEAVLAPCSANFEQLARQPLPEPQRARLERLQRWTLAEHARLRPLIASRLAQGRVRECHGDLHLANIVLLAGEPVVFDALEFNPALRWIDVVSEIAFTVMDLEHRGRHDLAQRFLDDYLAASGDYAGLALLPFYLVYRALVRTKVAALRAGQPEGEHGQAHARADAREIETHLALAERFAAPRPRCLVTTHGVSGSGKSFTARLLLQAGPWIRLRSDIERKRLAGLAPLADSRSGAAAGLYTASMTERTYARLLELARQVLTAGFPVIVDAAFLRAEQRRPFAELARSCGLAWVLLALDAPEATLRARVERRRASGSDPSEATLPVLERQLAGAEPPAGEELAHTVAVDTRDASGPQRLEQELARRCGAVPRDAAS
ncbi:MAG: AAA family ATPase [Burkholderiales bacterium]|nr:MAG: AAA family ATPase [Burkholderiales bacterium]